jgi:hypothetical protein
MVETPMPRSRVGAAAAALNWNSDQGEPGSIQREICNSVIFEPTET